MRTVLDVRALAIGWQGHREGPGQVAGNPGLIPARPAGLASLLRISDAKVRIVVGDPIDVSPA